MERLKLALACALLAALTAATVQAVFLLRAATASIRALPAAVSGELQATRADLVGQVAAAREGLAGQIEAGRKDLLGRTDRQVAALRSDVMGQVAETRRVADQRIGDTLARVDTALGKVEELRGDLKPVLDHSASVTKQVDDAAPLFLDCDHNPDCAFNRFQGASKAFERGAINFGQMSQDLQVALPGFVANANSLVADSAATANNIKRLTTPKWYDRLIGYGLNGVVIYRNLNPITNLTVKGAQILASRP